MKLNGALLFLALFLTANGVKGQDIDISRLRSESITLSRTPSKEKTARSPYWILAETELKRTSSDQYKPGTVNVIHAADPTSINYPPPSPASPPGPKRRYSIRYGGLSLYGDYQWLQLEVAPEGGTGLLKDLGPMSWSQLDRMPTLVLKPIPHELQVSSIKKESLVGPDGFIVKAVTGHLYAVHIRDDQTDFRALFRIESIDADGNCKLNWKRIPDK